MNSPISRWEKTEVSQNSSWEVEPVKEARGEPSSTNAWKVES